MVLGLGFPRFPYRCHSGVPLNGERAAGSNSVGYVMVFPSFPLIVKLAMCSAIVSPKGLKAFVRRLRQVPLAACSHTTRAASCPWHPPGSSLRKLFSRQDRSRRSWKVREGWDTIFVLYISDELIDFLRFFLSYLVFG